MGGSMGGSTDEHQVGPTIHILQKPYINLKTLCSVEHVRELNVARERSASG